MQLCVTGCFGEDEAHFLCRAGTFGKVAGKKMRATFFFFTKSKLVDGKTSNQAKVVAVKPLLCRIGSLLFCEG